MIFDVQNGILNTIIMRYKLEINLFNSPWHFGSASTRHRRAASRRPATDPPPAAPRPAWRRTSGEIPVKKEALELGNLWKHMEKEDINGYHQHLLETFGWGNFYDIDNPIEFSL